MPIDIPLDSLKPSLGRPALVAWRLAICAFAYLLAMAICFRDPLLSGMDLGFGYRADGLIELSILEHWNNVLHGHGAWNTPLYFHPYRDTLGYNDGYLLYGLTYSVLRHWFDPFLSDTLNVFVIKTTGFFAVLILIGKVFRWPFAVAIMAAVLFTVANSLAVQAVHAQLQSIALLPVLMIFACLAARFETAGRLARARSCAVAAAAVTAMWLITSYYLAWFTLFLAGVFLACLWLQTPRALRLGRTRALVQAHWLTIAIALASFVLFCAPFLWVYLPKVLETGGHPFKDALRYLVTPYDPINVGPGNLLWGWINRYVFGTFAPAQFITGEHESGFPLILFALFARAAYLVLKDGGRRLDRPATPLLRAFTWAILASWLLTIQLGPLSPWRLVVAIVPGANGLRTVLRYQLFLTLPVLIVISAVYRDRFMQLLRTRPALAAALICLLVLENLNLESAAHLHRSDQLAALGAIPSPPPSCRSFVLVSARPHEGLYVNARASAVYPHNVDAMVLAQRWRLPTINGYSTFNPPDWNFADPLAPDYAARVQAYAVRHDLHGLCRLDMRRPIPWDVFRP